MLGILTPSLYFNFVPLSILKGIQCLVCKIPQKSCAYTKKFEFLLRNKTIKQAINKIKTKISPPCVSSHGIKHLVMLIKYHTDEKKHVSSHQVVILILPQFFHGIMLNGNVMTVDYYFLILEYFFSWENIFLKTKNW